MMRLDPDTGKQKFFEKDGTKSVLSAVISILIGMVVGTLIIIFVGMARSNITGSGIVEGIKLVFLGIFSTGREAGQLTFGFNPINLGNMLFRATPLIMTGLSVAVAFKTGLFNIGAPGQYLMGTTASLTVALSIPAGTLPGWLIWILAFLCGMLAGAVWGSIPGLLKAFLNINEVITSIMTNWIAANLACAGNITWKRRDVFSPSNNVLKNAYCSLRLDFMPSAKLRIYADAAGTTCEITHGRYSTDFFVNAGARMEVMKTLAFTLSAVNLLDRKSYETSAYRGANYSYFSVPLRGRTVMFSATLKF